MMIVPLPAHEHLNYSELIPSPSHQLQGFTHQEGTRMVGASGDRDTTVHVLRQHVLVLEQMLQRARQGVRRIRPAQKM